MDQFDPTNIDEQNITVDRVFPIGELTNIDVADLALITNARENLSWDFEEACFVYLNQLAAQKSLIQLIYNDHPEEFTFEEIVPCDYDIEFRNRSVADGISAPDFIGVLSDENGNLYLLALDAKAGLTNNTGLRQISAENLRALIRSKAFPENCIVYKVDRYKDGKYVVPSTISIKSIENYKDHVILIEHSPYISIRYPDTLEYLAKTFGITEDMYTQLLVNARSDPMMTGNAFSDLGRALVHLTEALHVIYLLDHKKSASFADIKMYCQSFSYENMVELFEVLNIRAYDLIAPKMFTFAVFKDMLKGSHLLIPKIMDIPEDIELELAGQLFRVFGDLVSQGVIPYAHIKFVRKNTVMYALKEVERLMKLKRNPSIKDKDIKGWVTSSMMEAYYKEIHRL